MLRYVADRERDTWNQSRKDEKPETVTLCVTGEDNTHKDINHSATGGI